MALFMLSLLTPALDVQFGRRDTWVTKPYAKVTVVARGTIAPELVRMHVLEVKQSVHAMLRNRPKPDDALGDDDISIDIKRTPQVDDEEASISTSIIMATTTSGTTVMY
jgi:hypothetical protein